MKLRLLLATAAEVRDQMLFVLGGGWTDIGPVPCPFAIAGILEVTWEETNHRRKLEFLIEDEDGHPLNVPTPAGEQPLKFQADFDIGRPPGAQPGSSFNMPIALPLAPIPWTPGRTYIVKVNVDGKTMDEVTFRVRPQAQPQPPPQTR